MKSLVAVLAALGSVVSVATAGIVIAPINGDQVVEAMPGDCYFGVVTPQGCGPLRESLEEIQKENAAQALAPTK